MISVNHSATHTSFHLLYPMHVHTYTPTLTCTHAHMQTHTQMLLTPHTHTNLIMWAEPNPKQALVQRTSERWSSILGVSSSASDTGHSYPLHWARPCDRGEQWGTCLWAWPPFVWEWFRSNAWCLCEAEMPPLPHQTPHRLSTPPPPRLFLSPPYSYNVWTRMHHWEAERAVRINTQIVL